MGFILITEGECFFRAMRDAGFLGFDTSLSLLLGWARVGCARCRRTRTGRFRRRSSHGASRDQAGELAERAFFIGLRHRTSWRKKFARIRPHALSV